MSDEEMLRWLLFTKLCDMSSEDLNRSERVEEKSG